MNDIISNIRIDKIYSATTMYTDEGVTKKRYDRNHWAVVIKYEGETVYKNEGQTIVSNINNMVILPCGSNYEWICTKSGHYACIEFECSLKCKEIFSFHVQNHDEIIKLFKNLEHKVLNKNPLYKLESIRDTYTIILKLIYGDGGGYVPTAKAKKLIAAHEYILSHYTENIKNDTLAEISGMSCIYFRKLFCEVYGTSPIHYIIALRIKKAKEMLRSDYSSITDIAISLGYSSIYDFSKAFKKQTGLSPKKYAEEAASK